MSAEATNLWCAVVYQAVLDAHERSGAKDKKRLMTKAKAWANSRGTGIGSLKWICKACELDHQYVKFYIHNGVK